MHLYHILPSSEKLLHSWQDVLLVIGSRNGSQKYINDKAGMGWHEDNFVLVWILLAFLLGPPEALEGRAESFFHFHSRDFYN